jgi:hypothetical protein
MELKTWKPLEAGRRSSKLLNPVSSGGCPASVSSVPLNFKVHVMVEAHFKVFKSLMFGVQCG